MIKLSSRAKSAIKRSMLNEQDDAVRVIVRSIVNEMHSNYASNPALDNDENRDLDNEERIYETIETFMKPEANVHSFEYEDPNKVEDVPQTIAAPQSAVQMEDSLCCERKYEAKCFKIRENEASEEGFTMSLEDYIANSLVMNENIKYTTKSMYGSSQNDVATMHKPASKFDEVSQVEGIVVSLDEYMKISKLFVEVQENVVKEETKEENIEKNEYTEPTVLIKAKSIISSNGVELIVAPNDKQSHDVDNISKYEITEEEKARCKGLGIDTVSTVPNVSSTVSHNAAVEVIFSSNGIDEKLEIIDANTKKDQLSEKFDAMGDRKLTTNAIMIQNSENTRAQLAKSSMYSSLHMTNASELAKEVGLDVKAFEAIAVENFNVFQRGSQWFVYIEDRYSVEDPSLHDRYLMGRDVGPGILVV